MIFWSVSHAQQPHGEVEQRDIRHVFVMAGAVPATHWVDGCLELDTKGFILTGNDLPRDKRDDARWPAKSSALPARNDLPGVFAVGDVRAGNVKRVTSAVGEGSIAISFVHRVLAE
jgi:thioredoxin reductase (NADPH)